MKKIGNYKIFCKVLGLMSIFFSSLCAGQNYEKLNSDFFEKSQKYQAEVDAKIDHLRAQTDRLKRDSNYLINNENSISQLIERTQQERLAEQQIDQENAERESVKEERELERSRVGDLITMIVASLAIGSLVFIIFKIKVSGKIMEYHKKYGTMIMIFSIIISLMVVIISDDYNPRYDVLQNVMLILHVRMFGDSDGINIKYLIDLPTKYLILSFLTLFAYGLTSYLGITPAWRISSKHLNR